MICFTTRKKVSTTVSDASTEETNRKNETIRIKYGAMHKRFTEEEFDFR